MTTLNLTKYTLPALQELQQQAERWVALIEDTTDYIIDTTDEWANTGDAKTAIALIRNLRQLSDHFSILEAEQILNQEP